MRPQWRVCICFFLRLSVLYWLDWHQLPWTCITVRHPNPKNLSRLNMPCSFFLMQSWMSWLGCIWVLRFIQVSIHLSLSISFHWLFFSHKPTCWFCTLKVYCRHFKIQCTPDSCYFIVYSCAMCKLGMISCFTKTELYWNFIYSIWTVWFVCSKLHNWLHSDFQAFFLVSSCYGVYQD